MSLVKYSTRIRIPWRHGARSLSGHSVLLKSKRRDIQPKEPTVTRFAPSPTGLLHLGSLRTALYNFLLARNTGGKFLLRLEDTDRNRYHEDAERNIIDTLKWCGIQWDGEMVRQSDRTRDGVYDRYVNNLLERKLAYKCFCSKERLDSLRNDGYDRHCEGLTEEKITQLEHVEKRPYTVRLKMDRGPRYVNDLLHGQVLIQERKDRCGFDDPILLKSDGFPTYHLANVVDDHLMKVTHVIRGEEWLPSTPKHLALYDAFGWSAPDFIHIPLLTNMNSDKKLSKRQNDSSVIGLRTQGVLPEALINFVVLLGWSPPRSISQLNHECFPMDELVNLFNLNHLTRGNVKVDMKKLQFFNKHFLQKRIEEGKEIDDLVSRVVSQCELQWGSANNVSRPLVKKILVTCGDSLSNINEFVSQFGYFFMPPEYHDDDDVELFVTVDNKQDILKLLTFVQTGLANSGDITQVLDSFISSKHSVLTKKIVYTSIRYGLTGMKSGVKLPIIVEFLGLENVQKRLYHFSHYLLTLKKIRDLSIN